jgi:hypothetical protein
VLLLLLLLTTCSDASLGSDGRMHLACQLLPLLHLPLVLLPLLVMLLPDLIMTQRLVVCILAFR